VGAQSRYFEQRGHSVLALDLPGHGNDGAALVQRPAMADWLLAALDAAGVAQAALVGHSMGSLIALEAAARAPQRVTHLALLGTTYPMKVADALLDTARNDEAKAIAMVTKWSHSPAMPTPNRCAS
jgi:pimeloyl-ACP methyl ester carboxylesterase